MGLGAPPPLPSSSPCSRAFPLSCPLRSCLGLQLEVAADGKGGVGARFAEGGEERETDASAVGSVWMGGEREDAVRRENTWICGAWGAGSFFTRPHPHPAAERYSRRAMRICSFFRMRDEMGDLLETT